MAIRDKSVSDENLEDQCELCENFDPGHLACYNPPGSEDEYSAVEKYMYSPPSCGNFRPKQVTAKANTKVQSVIFDVNKFSESEAKEWAKKNGYKYGDVDTTDNYHRLRQYDPVKDAKMRTKDLGNGVKLILEIIE